jgi:hypothetical protein
MKKIYIILIGSFLLIAALTNPSRGVHISVFTQHTLSAYKEVFGRDIDEGSAGGHGSLTMYHVVSDVVHTRNFFFFSIDKYSYKGETRTIGIGALGRVYLLRKVDRENMKNARSVTDWVKF